MSSCGPPELQTFELTVKTVRDCKPAGLFGELHRAQLLLVVLAAWVVMLAWSKPWLAHFRYGPLEWLWRCLTYWRIVPLRR